MYEPGDSPIVTEEGEPIEGEDDQFLFIPEVDIMEAVKISEFTEITELNDEAYLPIVFNGQNYKITKANLLSLLQGEVDAVENEVTTLSSNVESLNLELDRKLEGFYFTVPLIITPTDPYTITNSIFTDKSIQEISFGNQVFVRKTALNDSAPPGFTQATNTLAFDGGVSFTTGDILYIKFATS